MERIGFDLRAERGDRLALFRAGELGPIGFDPLVFGFVRRVGRSGNPLRNCAGRPRRRKRRIGAAPRASTMQASPKCNQIERSSFPPPSPFLSWSAAPTRTLPARGHYTIRCKTFGKLFRSLARMRKSEPPAQARGGSRAGCCENSAARCQTPRAWSPAARTVRSHPHLQFLAMTSPALARSAGGFAAGWIGRSAG
jgi:hypothetical protein